MSRVELFNINRLLNKAMAFSFFILVSCVAVEGEKKASCGEGKEYDRSKQRCELSTASVAPIGSLTQVISMNEDGAEELITLSYTDLEGDLAINCRVTETHTNIEISSPVIKNAQAAITQIMSQFTLVDTTMTAGNEGTGSDALVIANYASATSKVTSTISSIDYLSYSNLLKEIADLAKLAGASGKGSISSTVIVQATILENLADGLLVTHDKLDRRCECSGGVCTSLLNVKRDTFGSYGFSYTVEDSSGLSEALPVRVDVASVNDVPGIEHVYVNDLTVTPNTDESIISGVAATYTFEFQGEVSLSGDSYDADGIFPVGDFLTYSYGPAAAGSRTCFFDYAANKHKCTYTPTDGDLFSTGTSADKSSLADYGGGTIDFTARNVGVDGDSITITFKARAGVEKPGDAVEVEVIGGVNIVVTIIDGVTTDTEIGTAIEAHPGASGLVAVSGYTAIATSVNSAVALSGGADNAFDSFTYTVSDGTTSVIGKVTIDITSAEDPPVIDTTSFVGNTIFEGETNKLVKFNFTDPDTTVTFGATCTSLAPVNVTVDTACVCNLVAGECQVGLTPTNPDPSATLVGAISVRVTSPDGAASPSSGSEVITITINNVNDNPEFPGETQSIEALLESTTSIASSYPFTITPATDVDDTTLVYTTTAGMTTFTDDDLSNGEVTDCMDRLDTGADADSTDLDCIYTPADGNVSGGMGGFKVTVTDGGGSTDAVDIDFTITSQSDSEVLCQISGFDEAPECGIDGCYGADQTGVTPSKAGLYFYKTGSAICYMSKDVAGTMTWVDVNDAGVTTEELIRDQYVTQSTELITGKIFIDEGGEGAEDEEVIKVEVSSSNETLIPISISNIFIDKIDLGSFDQVSSVLDAGKVVFSGTNLDPVGPTSADDNILRLRFKPVATLSGYSDITVTILSDNVATTTYTFKLTVTDITVNHGGWEKISATGPTINKFLKVKDQNTICNYSRTSCSLTGASTDVNSDCTGIVAPEASVYAADVGVVYLDSLTNKCYHSTAAGVASWSEFTSFATRDGKNYCQVSHFDQCEDGASVILGCVGVATPSGSVTPDFEDVFFYDDTAGVCYRSIGAGNNDWETYLSPGVAKFSWNPFSVTGSGSLTGYNVYRRLNGSVFDYTRPINKVSISSTVTSYEDNSDNSWLAPAPKTVYVYDIRPIISFNTGSETVSLVANPSVNYQEVDVILPDENQSFVHRWIVNQSVCRGMENSNSKPAGWSIDNNNNFRCPYAGPGDFLIGTETATYYDIGKHLIVDRFEAGCPYTIGGAASDCFNFTSDGSCIGIGLPDNSDTNNDNRVYYDRSSGICYKDNGAEAGEWSQVVGADIIPTNYLQTELPPLVNISQSEASLSCAALTGMTPFDSDASTTLGVAGQKRLPTRVEQVAYSHWFIHNSLGISDATANSYEQGLSLNSTSKCNTVSASGLSSFYTDANIPGVSAAFTIPGSLSSPIRSLYTGSDETKNCQSRFDIQDSIGNVSEWSSDSIVFTTTSGTDVGFKSVSDTLKTYAAKPVELSTIQPATNETYYNGFSLGYQDYSDYGTFDVLGPCASDDSVAFECQADLTSWTLDLKYNNSGRFLYPAGLPVNENYSPSVTKFATDPVAQYTLEIGPSVGITATQLHDDGVEFNTALIRAGSSSAFLVGGGSYLNGNAAGTFFLETIEQGVGDRDDVGFRCVTTVCDYSKMLCEGGEEDCTGEEDPTTNRTPSQEGVIFWDSVNRKCYRATGTGDSDWVEI